MILFIVISAIIAVLTAASFWPHRGLLARWEASRALADRALFEDFLKHIHARQLQGNLATTESLAGSFHLQRSFVVEKISEMESNGLLKPLGTGITLTEDGNHLALQVVRAHRLLERYLFDELRMPLGTLHQEADRREHALSPAEVDELDARLGYPELDPHGDPIPTVTGMLESIDSRSIVDWPDGVAAEIVHLEDEPPELFKQVLASGLVPGMHIDVLERRDNRLVLWDGDKQYLLPELAATNVFVRALPHPVEPSLLLTHLNRGETARITRLESEGLARRRLLDLGLTPGTEITRELDAPLGEPSAYRVREALIALRSDDASKIMIERLPSDRPTES